MAAPTKTLYITTPHTLLPAQIPPLITFSLVKTQFFLGRVAYMARLPRMHPFRSVYMPNDASIEALWPKVGSIFDEEPSSPSPLLPIARRLPHSKSEIAADEYAAHIDGLWMPFSNSCLAKSCGLMDVVVRAPTPKETVKKLVHHSPTDSSFVTVVKKSAMLDPGVMIMKAAAAAEQRVKRTVTILVDQTDLDKAKRY